MAQVNFYLRDTTGDKTTAVMLLFSFKGVRFKAGTVDHIQPKYWDSGKQRAKQTKSFNTYPEFNAKLDNIENDVMNVYRKFVNDNDQQQPTKLQIKQLILAKVLPEKVQVKTVYADLISFTELFIKDTETGKRLSERGTPIQPNTIKIYKTFKRNLIDFKTEKKYDLNFENIGLAFFEDFKEYLTFNKRYTTNTLSKHIRTIKNIVGEAFERGFTKIQFTGKRYKAKTEEIETVYLKEKELDAIRDLDLVDNPRLDRVRDLFLVGAWTGLRFSDFNNISPKSIIENRIELKTQKTKHRVSIPIFPDVRTIMKKYHGKTENSLPPPISNQKMNEYLKEIAKKAEINEMITLQFTKAGKEVIKIVPKHALVSSHTARRSFATNMWHRKIPTISIMGITGHKTESAFIKYIRATNTDHAENVERNMNSEVLLRVV